MVDPNAASACCPQLSVLENFWHRKSGKNTLSPPGFKLHLLHFLSLSAHAQYAALLKLVEGGCWQPGASPLPCASGKARSGNRSAAFASERTNGNSLVSRDILPVQRSSVISKALSSLFVLLTLASVCFPGSFISVSTGCQIWRNAFLPLFRGLLGPMQPLWGAVFAHEDPGLQLLESPDTAQWRPMRAAGVGHAWWRLNVCEQTCSEQGMWEPWHPSP